VQNEPNLSAGAKPARLSRHADPWKLFTGAFGSAGVLAAAEPIAARPLAADIQGGDAVEAGAARAAGSPRLAEVQVVAQISR
jgi:hypothetical protein